MGTAYERGRILYGQKRYELAIREFERELATEPNNARCFAIISLCRMNLRHYLLAREAAEKSIAINPQYARGYYALAWTLFSDTRFVSNRKGEIPLRATRADVTQSRLRLASAATAAGLAISPRDVSFLVLKSMICLHSLDPHEALIAADEGLAIDPTSADCHRNRAMVLRYIGDTTGAEKASSHALATEPESPHSHYVAGWTALTSGRYSAARDHFITLLCVDPLFPHARTGLLFALRSQFWPYRPVVWVIVRSQNFLRSRVLFRPVFSIGSGLFFIVAAYAFGVFDIIVGDSSAAPKDPHTGLKIVAAAPFGLVMVIILLTSIADYILLFHALGRILLKPTQRVTAIAGAALVCSLGICGLLAFFPSYMDRYAIESIMAAFFLCGAVLFILPRLGNRGHHASVHE